MNHNQIIIPIVFAFNDKLILPSSVCIFSLLSNSKPSTFYDIFILHSSDNLKNKDTFEQLLKSYNNCNVTYVEVTKDYNDGYEVRGITKETYYRLLIPTLIPQYSKIIYADVDIIFRMDLSEFYSINIDKVYVAATYDLGMILTNSGRKHISDLGLEANKYMQAGVLLMNCKKMREDNLCAKFQSLYKNNYRFQDQDILNITCSESHLQLPIKYNMTDYSFIFIKEGNEYFSQFSEKELQEAMSAGNIHYNGHKPWKKYSLNFDIWWEYYRKSPMFDHDYYIDFYYNRLNIFDQLSLWKRIKILIRYFIYGKRKI